MIQNLGFVDSTIREGSLSILWELIDSGKLPLERMLSMSDHEKWLKELLNRFEGKSLLNYAGERRKIIPWFNYQFMKIVAAFMKFA